MRPFWFHGAAFFAQYLNAFNKQKGELIMFIEKKKWAAGLLLVLAVVCLASGCSLQKEAASDELWGRADAKEIDINSKVAGRVVQLRVKEGDTVKQGDIIAYIDQRDLLAQKAQAEANIKALQAQVRQSGVVTDLQDSTSKSQVDTASAGLDSAQSNLDLAEKDFNRYQELYAQGLFPNPSSMPIRPSTKSLSRRTARPSPAYRRPRLASCRPMPT